MTNKAFQGKGWYIDDQGYTHIEDGPRTTSIPPVSTDETFNLTNGSSITFSGSEPIFSGGFIPADLFPSTLQPGVFTYDPNGNAPFTIGGDVRVQGLGFDHGEGSPFEAISAYLQGLLFGAEGNVRIDQLVEQANDKEAQAEALEDLAIDAYDQATALREEADVLWHEAGIYDDEVVEQEPGGSLDVEESEAEAEFLDLVDELSEIVERFDTLADDYDLTPSARENASFLATVIHNAFHAIQEVE